MDVHSFDHSQPATPKWQLELRGSDYEISAFGQDMHADGRFEKALVQASRSLAVIVASLLGATIVWR